MSLQLNGTIGVIGPVNEGSVTATGSNTPRNLDDRFADVVNVKDFGAVGDGVHDDTTGIQSAIDYASSAPNASKRCVYFPTGYYKTSAPLVVERALHIKGESKSTNIFANHAGDGLVFQPQDAGTANSFLNGGKISDITISRNTSDTSGSAIWLRQCSGVVLDTVGANNHQYNIRISGGQGNQLNNITTFNFAPFTQVSTGASILFERADIGGGNFQACYTVSINNYFGSSGNLLPNIIRIHSADGLNINNAYIAFGWSSLIRFARQTTGDQITAINISNVYCDCVDNIRDGVVVVPKAVLIRHELGSGNHEGCRSVQFSNCFFGNNDGLNEYLIAVQRFSDLKFSNCTFANASDFAIGVSDGSDTGNNGIYIITGCTFKNLSQINTGGGAITITDAQIAVLNGNCFVNTFTATYQILLTGGLDSGSVIGNSADNSAAKILNTSGLSLTYTLVAHNANDQLFIAPLPTSSVGLPSGAMWNNSGVVNIVP